MEVRIITDSASDITQEQAAKWNICVLPLTIRFGDEEFSDGVTIDNDMFYNRLIETDIIPKTSQVTPFAYEQAFREAIDTGDEVVCITISSKLSGCWQSACIAADEIKSSRIHIIDTMTVCVAEMILVERAVQLRNKCFDAGKIASEL